MLKEECSDLENFAKVSAQTIGTAYLQPKVGWNRPMGLVDRVVGGDVSTVADELPFLRNSARPQQRENGERKETKGARNTNRRT